MSLCGNRGGSHGGWAPKWDHSGWAAKWERGLLGHQGVVGVVVVCHQGCCCESEL